ncbi:hypothetical protein J416_00469 [Gracilibacillus halophilus YIM-C55.5]|uniref:DUF4129 domain-containing protein n=1 Tax=Gracilibacillus halophilus YIM-C55.5 TaxID=1308866 RepID=N4WVI8_9BACI|nr:hypothetical protein [Gracilibacillus halophilus]ENH98415.1 hypothetical protein J416_00469 [Gracilibacillus halophilus YIM-C55.5]
MQAKMKPMGLMLVQGLVELLGFFPILLAVAVLLNEAPYGWLIGLYFVFAVSAVSRYIFVDRTRWIFLFLAVVLSGLFAVVATDSWIGAAISLIIGSLAGYRGLLYGENEWSAILPNRIFWAICMPIYLIGYLVFVNVDRLTADTDVISYAGFLFLLCMLFVTNGQHLQKATLEKGKKARVGTQLRRLNQVYLVATLGLVFLLTNFQIVQSAVFHGIRSVIQSVIWFGELFQNDSDVRQEQPQQGAMQPPFSEEEEPSAFAQLMETIMYGVGIILIVALVLLLIAVLFKKARAGIKRVIGSLWRLLKDFVVRRKPEETMSEYMDEKENLWNWQDWRKKQQEKFTSAVKKVMTRKPKFDQLSDEEKVRYLYRVVAKKVYEQGKWSPAYTAHEVVEQSDNDDMLKQLERLYDHVRYGNETIQSQAKEDIEAISNRLLK